MDSKARAAFFGFAILALTGGAVAAGNERDDRGEQDCVARDAKDCFIPPAWSQRLAVKKRFELVMGNKAVLDKETGLVWTQEAGDVGGSPDSPWINAVDNCYGVHFGTGRKGWRLPTIEELSSLLVVGGPPAFQAGLPAGHPFTLATTIYWSITSLPVFPGDTSRAMVVNFGNGAVGADFKSNAHGFWCVRGGHGHDPAP